MFSGEREVIGATWRFVIFIRLHRFAVLNESEGAVGYTAFKPLVLSDSRRFGQSSKANRRPTEPARPLAPLRGEARVAPAFPAAIHRFHVGVTHFLQALRHERGAKSAAAI